MKTRNWIILREKSAPSGCKPVNLSKQNLKNFPDLYGNSSQDIFQLQGIFAIITTIWPLSFMTLFPPDYNSSMASKIYCERDDAVIIFRISLCFEVEMDLYALQLLKEHDQT